MSDERLSDWLVKECVTFYERTPTEAGLYVRSLAREVQEWRNTFGTIEHGRATALDDARLLGLCARHGITVEGIVALVDEVFTDRSADGVVLDAVKGGFRRLARGKDA